MPNWVYNRVTVYGTPEQLEAFRVKAGKPGQFRDADGDESLSVFSFWNFVRPEPEILDEYWGGTSEMGLSFDYMKENNNNWYSWNNRNWGTKWDASGPEFIDSDTGEMIEYTFDTAWAPPVPVFRAIVEQHPDLKFFFLYEEEQGWGGEMQSVNGELVQVDEWDIPDSHGELMERKGDCWACNEYDYLVEKGREEEGQKYLFTDCPKKKQLVS